MNIQVSDQVLPAVIKIIEDTERQLSHLAGYSVAIKLSVNPTDISESAIQMLICDYYNVSWAQIMVKGRKGTIVKARQMYCYLAYHLMNNKMVTIGRQLGQDHTTIINSINTIEGYIKVKDAATINAIKFFEEKFKLPLINDNTINQRRNGSFLRQA